MPLKEDIRITWRISMNIKVLQVHAQSRKYVLLGIGPRSQPNSTASSMCKKGGGPPNQLVCVKVKSQRLKLGFVYLNKFPKGPWKYWREKEGI